MTITMNFSGIGFGFLNYNFISDLHLVKNFNVQKYLKPLCYSFDEIVAHHEIFTGSEATDFGEHLTLQQMKRFEEEL